MAENRTFTGMTEGLETGSKFIVMTSAGNRPHVDTARMETFEVTRREAGRVVAREAVVRLDERHIPMFSTYTSRPDAPLRRTG